MPQMMKELRILKEQRTYGCIPMYENLAGSEEKKVKTNLQTLHSQKTKK